MRKINFAINTPKGMSYFKDDISLQEAYRVCENVRRKGIPATFYFGIDDVPSRNPNKIYRGIEKRYTIGSYLDGIQINEVITFPAYHGENLGAPFTADQRRVVDEIVQMNMTNPFELCFREPQKVSTTTKYSCPQCGCKFLIIE